MAPIESIESIESKGTIAVSGGQATEPDELVDRGARAWTVVLGAWCCLFCGFGWVNGEFPSVALPPFARFEHADNLMQSLLRPVSHRQEYYQNHQLRSYSSSSIAWILSLEPFVLFAAGLVIGRVSSAPKFPEREVFRAPSSGMNNH